jgi:hypothetical protein
MAALQKMSRDSMKGTGRLGGLEAMRLEFGRAEDAVNVDSDCPPEVRPCVGLLSFPQWGGESYSQGGPFHLVLIAVDAKWDGESHGVYAMIDAGNDDVFAEWAGIGVPTHRRQVSEPSASRPK